MISLALVSLETSMSPVTHQHMTSKSLKRSKTFMQKHMREIFALAAGAAIASGATAYGMKKKEAKKIAVLNKTHLENLANNESRYERQLHADRAEYLASVEKNQAFFKEQLAYIKATLEETIQRTVTVSLEKFQDSLNMFQTRIDEMLKEQHALLKQGVEDFKVAGREQQEASARAWQEQFTSMGERFATMFDAHATKLASEYTALQKELAEKQALAEARDIEHKAQIQEQLEAQKAILSSSLKDALRTLDQHKTQMIDLVKQSNELVTHATEAQRQELARHLQEISTAGQRFEASQTQAIGSLHGLIEQTGQHLLGTIDTGMAQGFAQQNRAITDGLVTGFGIQQQQVGQLVAGRGGMRMDPLESSLQRAPLLLEGDPAVNPFSSEAQGTVQGPVSPRSQEELEVLDPAPSQRQQSGSGSVALVRSRSSQKSSALGRSQERQQDSVSGHYVLSPAAQKRIEAGKVLRRPEVQHGMRRAQEILAQQEFQPAVGGNRVPLQMRTGRAGGRTSRVTQQSLYGKSQQVAA